MNTSTFAGVALATLAAAAAPAAHAESFHHCTGFIDTLPAVIATQGTWCLRADLGTSITSGQAIQVATNNVTIDCNGFKIGSLNAGTDTLAYGIRSSSRRNIVVRSCHVRGFLRGIALTGAAINGGHVVEDNRVELATLTGIWVYGDGSVVRRNIVLDIGGTHSYPSGISAGYRTFVHDNVVSGVDSTLAPYYSNTFGISLNYPGGSVTGNRISGLVRASEGGLYGINSSNADESEGVVIAGNHVTGDGGTGVGVSCNSHGIAAGNLVVGMSYAVGSCTDGGGNVLTP